MSLSTSSIKKRHNESNGLCSNQVRNILIESFRLFHGLEYIAEKKLREFEDRVFKGSVFLSPRTTAKAILEIMDSFKPSDLEDEEINTHRSHVSQLNPAIRSNQLK